MEAKWAERETAARAPELQIGDAVSVRPRLLLTFAVLMVVAAAAGAPPAEAGRSLGASYAARRKASRARSLVRSSTSSKPASRSGSLVRRPSSRGVSRGQARIRFPRGATSIPARVTVNGTASGQFIVDTGATSVAVSTRFARQLGLDLRGAPTVKVMTAAGPETALRTRVKRLELAGAVAEDVEILVMSDPAGPGADGLLGLSFLSRFHMSLDAHEGILELRAP